MEQAEKSLEELLNTRIPIENIHMREPMSLHTTFKVGGEAKALIDITEEDQIMNIIPLLIEEQESYFIKGNGSNILVGDKGYDGVVLEISRGFNRIEILGNTIRAKAGAFMSQIAKAALDNSLSGFEFASGIPGTIGGGVVMNAGAYGGELKDVVKEVKVLSPDGEILFLSNDDMEFGYRTSAIKNRAFVVLEVSIELSEGDSKEIESRMNELNLQRRQKQPLEYPSAGSTFKRPEGYFAGKLIMDTGLRGFSIGGAQVSEKHCGFVVNKANATATDVYELICEVKERVYNKFGVELEPEIIFLGEF